MDYVYTNRRNAEMVENIRAAKSNDKEKVQKRLPIGISAKNAKSKHNHWLFVCVCVWGHFELAWIKRISNISINFQRA